MRAGSLVIGLVVLVFGGILFFDGLSQFQFGQTVAGEVSSGFNNNLAVEGLGTLIFGGIIGLAGLAILARGFGGPKVAPMAAPVPITVQTSGQSSGVLSGSKYCSTCGGRLAMTAAFCSGCGRPQG